ncbi:hypothetical protein AAY473_037236 [Plecturocebus cupreus]
MASSIKSSSSSCGDLQTLAQQGLPRNCGVPACIGNEGLETLTLQALQHNLMASSLTQRTTQSTVAQQSSQEATVLQARRPEAELAWPSSSWGCRKAARSSTSSVGDLETLAQQALQCNCVVAACIGNKDLETLTRQALQHDLMASSFTQSTTQSTVAQQSSQEATVLQARQPEAVLAWPTSSWGCRKAARRCISILMRGPNKPSGKPDGLLLVISISSRGDLKPCLSKPSRNRVASSIKSSTSKSSTSSGGDLETLAQQALQCNCVVVAYIGNKDLETLTLQALQHDLMACSFTQSTTQSTVAQQSSQEPTVLQARQPELCWPGQAVAGAAARLPGDAFQY